MLAVEWGAAFAAGVCVLLGAFFVLGGTWWLVDVQRARNPATGIIIDLISDGEDDQPVVRFTTSHGAVTHFTAQGAMGYRIGQHVPVRYRSKDPTKARIATFRGSYLMPLGLVLLGALSWFGAVSAWNEATTERRGATPDSGLATAREPVYRSLVVAVSDLGECADRMCNARTEQRRLRAYDRARSSVVRSNATSSTVKQRIADLQHGLAPVRRHERKVDPALTKQLDALFGEMLQEVCAAPNSRPPYCKIFENSD